MRKTFSLLVTACVIAASFAFVTTTKTTTKAANADIAVLLPDAASSARWETDDRKYLSAAFDAAKVSYNIVNANGDKTQQLTQAEQAITNGAKVILFVDLDAASGAAIIKEAHAAGVKVIDYDRLTTEDKTQGDAADYYVSFDNVAVGKLQGQGLVDAVKAAGIKNPKVAELNGAPTDNNAKLFKQGYDSVLQPLYDDKTSGWTKVEDQSVPDWDNQKALTIFEQMLTKENNKIDAAVAANDGLAQAVISALANAGLKPIPVTGQDATVGGIQNILAGKQSMTVYKAIKDEANGAASLAIALVNGGDTSKLVSGKTNNGVKDVPSVLLTPTAVTKANVADTVIKDGFRKWSEICTGDFTQYCPADWNMAGTMAATMGADMNATMAPTMAK